MRITELAELEDMNHFIGIPRSQTYNYINFVCPITAGFNPLKTE